MTARATKAKGQTAEHKPDSRKRDITGNAMQKGKHIKPMTGRDAGEHGKSWSDHFGDKKRG
jgi:hypothetical protein